LRSRGSESLRRRSANNIETRNAADIDLESGLRLEEGNNDDISHSDPLRLPDNVEETGLQQQVRPENAESQRPSSSGSVIRPESSPETVPHDSKEYTTKHETMTSEVCIEEKNLSVAGDSRRTRSRSPAEEKSGCDCGVTTIVRCTVGVCSVCCGICCGACCSWSTFGQLERIFRLSIPVFSILLVELTLRWNGVSGVNGLSSAGQLIALIVSIGTFTQAGITILINKNKSKNGNQEDREDGEVGSDERRQSNGDYMAERGVGDRDDGDGGGGGGDGDEGEGVDGRDKRGERDGKGEGDERDERHERGGD
jgi:hypothetical protein